MAFATIGTKGITDAAIATDDIADNAVTSGKIAGGVIPASRPNVSPLLMNCNMAVSQRNGTTATTIGSEAYSLDRWSFREISNGSTTVQQTTTVPSGKGFANSLKVAVTGADTSIIGDNIVAIAQKLEGQDAQLLKFGTSDAQKITISFWVRSNVTGTYSATLRHTNTSGTAYVNSLTFSISSGDTWEQKVLVFNANTSQDIRNTNTEGIRLEIMLTVGSDYTSGGGANANTWTTGNTNRASASNVNILSSTSNTFYLTGVQLEVGEYTSDTLPPFQHESFGNNLQRCQRYFYLNNTVSASMPFASGVVNGTTNSRAVMRHPQPMRAPPTMGRSDNTDFKVYCGSTNVDSTNVAFYYPNNYQALLYVDVSSGLTNGQGCVIIDDSGGSAYIQGDAEL